MIPFRKQDHIFSDAYLFLVFSNYELAQSPKTPIYDKRLQINFSLLFTNVQNSGLTEDAILYECFRQHEHDKFGNSTYDAAVAVAFAG